MSVFLLLDTATPVCSVALTHDSEIVFAKCELNPEGGAAVCAGVLVQEALQHCKVVGLRLSAVGISAGPGSYTGLRISSSIAKGLCHALQIPLIAVSTLQMMADAYRIEQRDTLEAHDVIAPMIDARRQEVYTATFSIQGQRLTEDVPRIVSAETYYDDAMQSSLGRYHFFGSGVSKAQGISLGEYHITEDFVAEAKHLLPSVLTAYDRQAFEDIAYFTPSYLKEYVAQVAKNKVLR